MGKDKPQNIESKPINLHTRIKRLVRRTLRFSKSKCMHAEVIGLFIKRYELGTAVSRGINSFATPSRKQTLLKASVWAPVNLMQAVFTICWTAFWILLALLIKVCSGLCGDHDLPLRMARTVWAPGLLLGAGVRLEIEGLENVNFEEPHFFVMNHQSLIDIVTVFRALPVNLRFVVKEELRYIPLLGWYISCMGMIYVNRSNRRRALASIRRVAEVLHNGHSIVAFPEGGRSRDETIGHFKTGVLIPPIETEVQIVPMAIDGAARVLPPGGFRVRPGLIRLAIGEPIPTTSLSIQDRYALTLNVRKRVIELHRDLAQRC